MIEEEPEIYEEELEMLSSPHTAPEESKSASSSLQLPKGVPDKAPSAQSRSSRNAKVLNDLRERLRQSNHACLKDGLIPWGLLSHAEFAVCMRGALILKKGKTYHFSEKGMAFLEGAPPPEVEDGPKDRNYKPRADTTPTAPTTAANPAPKQNATQREKRHMVPTPLAMGPANGDRQVILENVIYQETNKLGHHSLILLGKDGNGQSREILRGIPQSVACAIVEDPHRFQKKVFQIDERGNFIGFMLLPSLEQPANPVAVENGGPDI